MLPAEWMKAGVHAGVWTVPWLFHAVAGVWCCWGADDGRRARAGSITNRTMQLTGLPGIDGLNGVDLFLGAVQRTLSRNGLATADEKQSCQSISHKEASYVLNKHGCRWCFRYRPMHSTTQCLSQRLCRVYAYLFQQNKKEWHSKWHSTPLIKGRHRRSPISA